MPLPVDGKIVVAVQIVGEEAQAAFQGHGSCSPGQAHILRLRQLGAGADEALGKNAVQLQIHGDLAQVPLILRGGGGAEADGIPKVKGQQAGHHRIQVNDAEGLTGPGVQHHVIQLGVVMGDAQGQLPFMEHIHQRGPIGLPLQEFPDLILRVLCPAQPVFRQHGFELGITVRGIMEVLYGLMQGPGGEIRQLALEGAEGHGALVKILRRLRGLETKAVLHKVIDPPVALGAVMVIVSAVHRGHQMQAAPLLTDLFRQVTGDSTHVLHQAGNILEGHGAQALKNVSPAAVRHHKKGSVDMTAAIGLTAYGAAL